MLRLHTLVERFRGSLFYLPSLYVLAALPLAWGASQLDGLAIDPSRGSPLLLSVTVESARSILATIATATITVAGIVFSVTVISVQLASSQFSPRVLRGFLRDRFEQNVSGVVVATFTYCLLILASTQVAESQDPLSATPSPSVTLAIVLAIGSMLGIIGFIDHIARAMRVGDIINRVTIETHERAAHIYPHFYGDRPAEADPGSPPPDGTATRVLIARKDGYLQQISPRQLMAACPRNAYLRLDTQVGAFITKDTPLLTVWSEDEPHWDELLEAMTIGVSRTMQQDVGFGIRQLVDIALRALSPAINDPTTAIDVTVHLGAILADLLQRDLGSRVLTDEEGRVLAKPHDHTADAFIGQAFDQIRLSAQARPDVLVALLHTLGRLDQLMDTRDYQHRRTALRGQADLIVRTAAKTGYEQGLILESDLQRVIDVAVEQGLLSATH